MGAKSLSTSKARFLKRKRALTIVPEAPLRIVYPSWPALSGACARSPPHAGLAVAVGEADGADEVDVDHVRHAESALERLLDVDRSPVRSQSERGDRELHVRAGVRQAVGEVARMPPEGESGVPRRPLPAGVAEHHDHHRGCVPGTGLLPPRPGR